MGFLFRCHSWDHGQRTAACEGADLYSLEQGPHWRFKSSSRVLGVRGGGGRFGGLGKFLCFLVGVCFVGRCCGFGFEFGLLVCQGAFHNGSGRLGRILVMPVPPFAPTLVVCKMKSASIAVAQSSILQWLGWLHRERLARSAIRPGPNDPSAAPRGAKATEAQRGVGGGWGVGNFVAELGVGF